MYELRNRINKGIRVDVSELLLNQNNCWLDLCSCVSRLQEMNEIDTYCCDKKKVISILLTKYPNVVKFLTKESGEILVSSRSITFAGTVLGLLDDSLLILLSKLTYYLDKFDCYQHIYDSVGRKTGVGSYNPKISYDPIIHSKEYDGDIRILADCLFTRVERIDIGHVTVSKLKEELGIGTEDRLFDGLHPSFESEYIDLILDLCEGSYGSSICNKKLCKLVGSYNEKNIEAVSKFGSGFFYSFKVSILKKSFEALKEDSKSILSEVNSSLDALISATSIYENVDNKAVDELRNASGYCIDYATRKPLCWINNDLGYVGEYVDKLYLLNNGLESSHNPVSIYSIYAKSKSLKLVATPMYNVCWLSYKKNKEVKYEVDTYYDSMPYSFMDLLKGENLQTSSELSLEQAYKEYIKTLISGENEYKNELSSKVMDVLWLLCQGGVYVSDLSLASINSLEGTCLELYSDLDALIDYILN